MGNNQYICFASRYDSCTDHILLVSLVIVFLLVLFCTFKYRFNLTIFTNFLSFGRFNFALWPIWRLLCLPLQVYLISASLLDLQHSTFGNRLTNLLIAAVHVIYGTHGYISLQSNQNIQAAN